MTDIFMIYSTFPNKEEALNAAKALVEKRLVACANIYNDITSVYRWEGKMQQEQEAALIAKTQKATLQGAMDEIKRRHSYETPCIVAYPLAAGFPPFLEWVAEETA